MEEGLSSKEDALFFLFESAEACISSMAFNADFAELIWVVEVTGSNANKAKAWQITFSAKIVGHLPQEIEPNSSILNSD